MPAATLNNPTNEERPRSNEAVRERSPPDVPAPPTECASDVLLKGTSERQCASAGGIHAETQLAEQLRLAALVADVGVAVTEHGPQQELMQRCTDLIVRHLDVAFARIWSLKPNDNVLELQASAGMYTHLNGGHARIPVGKFKIGRIAQDRKPHFTNQAVGDPQVHDQEWARREGMVAFAGHPLIVGGAVRGVVALFSRQPLSAAARAALVVVADEIALGLERKQIEETLQQSETRLRAITDNMLDLVCQIDLLGAFQYASPSYATILGYEPADLLGKSSFDLVHPDDLAAAVAQLEATIRTRAAHPTKIRYRHADGHYLWLELVGKLVFDSAGQPTGLVIASRDVSERYQAEEKLRLQGAALEAAASSFVLTDRQGAIIWVNNAFARLTGYALEEVVGQNPRVLKSGKHDRSFYKKMWSTVLEGNVWKGEVVNRRKDGSLYTEEMTITPFSADGKGVTHFIAIKQEITERKRTEQTLAAVHAQLKAVLDGATQVAIFATDLSGLITVFNRGAERMLGYSAHDMIGRHTPEIFHLEAEVRARAQALTREWGRRIAGFDVFVEAARHGRHDAREWTYVRKDGAHCIVELVVTELRDPRGDINGFIGIARDITLRKQAEQELRASEETFRTISDSALDAVIMMDSAGNIQHWNPAAERTFGYRRDEVLGRDLHELVVPPEHDEQIRKGLAHFRQTGQGAVIGKVLEVEGLRKDGSRFPAEASVAAMQLHGAWTAVGVLRDITERKQVEKALRRAKEDAEAASRAKSDFLANMSHEIRTPMNGVLGMVELALDTELTENQRHYLEMAKSSADSLLRVINDILDFSKIEAGKLALESVPFRLRDTVGDLLKTLAGQAQKKGLELLLHVQPDVPECLTGDAMRLGQILVNLIGNAVKFTDRGEVVVDISATDVQRDQVYLRVAVTDTGIGIPPEKLQLIFEAFSQADTSMTRRFGGTGLGLTICARLAALMDGRIGVDSEVGRGSTFYVIARFGRHRETLRQRPGEMSLPEGLHVLVADDNATNREILTEMLGHWMFRATAASGGTAALAELDRAAAAGDPFRLVLLDAQMPDMDGFTTARNIRGRPGLDGAILMMLSSADLPEDVARCREAGIAKFLRKPVKQSDLLDAIVNAVHTMKKPDDRAAAPVPAATEKAAGLHILLAEDNHVNQLFAVRLLEKQGHEVAVAQNGREAVDASAKQEFDLILMDVQMPEMDGFAATAAIRARDLTTGRHTPIIALTAHAMLGDRERCLEAGMDGYAAKPLRQKELMAAIADVLAATQKLRAAAANGAADDAIWDCTKVLADLDGDRDLLQTLIGSFLDQSGPLLAEVRAGLDRGDSKALERAAHKLKGSVSYFAAAKALAAATRVEALGRNADLREADAATADLEQAIGSLRSAMGKFAAGGEP